ncbi:hypothetical protein niasHT_009728 [Heterodera trifolii]|uniref:Uncharacterized protein n=1 Tax=Heterodera trifolii TaxID=157864 RepID=A0ABD2MDJ0_9BILA
MELFILRHAEYERLYNCTGLDIDAIPLEKRQFVPESIARCVLCAIYYVLYLPCIYSIWIHMRDNSCYKLLFYIASTDLAILWILGFFSGWLNLQGAVFCSFPTLNYFVGIGVTALWMAESTADLVLAFNRCLEIGSPSLSHLLFSGRRVSLWLFGCSLYALYWALFLTPATYSSLYFNWFFYPFVGYRNDDQTEYEPRMHVVHNIAVAIMSPSIYLIFAAKLFADVRASRRRFGSVISELNAMQKRTFYQVFLVSLINTLTATICLYMQFYGAYQWLITLANFAWLHVHGLFCFYSTFATYFCQGLPPLIFLALNRTMRQDCRMLYIKIFKRNRISHISGISVVRRDTNLAASALTRH